MLIALNQVRRRHRHRLAAVLLAFALCWLLIAAHSALAERHMGDDVTACLAVAETAALVLAVALATCSPTSTLRACPRSRQLELLGDARLACAAPVPRSRAGPELLQVFRQ